MLSNNIYTSTDPTLLGKICPKEFQKHENTVKFLENILS